MPTFSDETLKVIQTREKERIQRIEESLRRHTAPVQEILKKEYIPKAPVQTSQTALVEGSQEVPKCEVCQLPLRWSYRVIQSEDRSWKCRDYFDCHHKRGSTTWQHPRFTGYLPSASETTKWFSSAKQSAKGQKVGALEQQLQRRENFYFSRSR
mmetsp:Transcript_21887/g.31389  ORF Transcript_21887/g.31389 Transcript_21887/m.31389 type:complete len:154 (-) Transcript_21887:2659-3120(-)